MAMPKKKNNEIKITYRCSSSDKKLKHPHMDLDEPPTPSPTSAANDNLKPVLRSERSLTYYDIAALWIGLVVSVPTYYLAGSLVELGMTWWQGITTIFIANTIILFPLILTAVPGTKYGVSFPVLARSSFGVRGAHIPTLLRAVVACGWFGIETWVGGQALFLLFPSSSSTTPPLIPFLGTSAIELLCFLLFWGIQMVVVMGGIGGIQHLNKYAAPILVLLTSALFIWAWREAGGLGEMLSPSVPVLPTSQFWALFFPSLTACVGGWATLAINIPDFSCYAKTQLDQVIGNSSLPIFMAAYTFAGLAITSATMVIYNEPISNPLKLVARINTTNNNIFLNLLAVFGIGLATITTNIPANVVAPTNALMNLSPSTFGFKTAALVTSTVGILMQPWRIFGSSGSFVMAWLVGSSSLLGPISGIVLTDYYILRRTVLGPDVLYPSSHDGFNPKAIVAFVVAIGLILPGFLNEVGVVEGIPAVFQMIYGVSWFFGFFFSAGLYWVLSSVSFSYPFVRSKGKEVQVPLLS